MTIASDDVPEPIAKSYDRILVEVAPGGRLSHHTPASVYEAQFQNLSTETIRNHGDLDANGLFHHISSQGAVVLMLARRVLELEPLVETAAELKAIKEMYNLP